MGYRIDIYNENKTINYYGTKHYGYSGDTSEELKEFPSFRYLIKIGKFKEDEFYVFDYGCHNEIILTAKQFEHFIKLYSKEWDNIKTTYKDWQDERTLLNEPKIVELLNDKTRKYISWM